MLIIRGFNVFPTQIEEVLVRMDGLEPFYQLVVDREKQFDTLEVRIEMTEQLMSDEIKVLSKTGKLIEKELFGALNIHSRVKFVEPKSIPRSSGKAERIIDKREV